MPDVYDYRSMAEEDEDLKQWRKLSMIFVLIVYTGLLVSTAYASYEFRQYQTQFNERWLEWTAGLDSRLDAAGIPRLVQAQQESSTGNNAGR